MTDFIFMVISNNISIPPFIIIIIFPTNEAYIMKTRNSDLGRRSPGGGRVRCKESVPLKKDTLGQVIAKFTITC